MKLILLSLTTLVLSNVSYATDGTGANANGAIQSPDVLWQYRTEDHFQWGNYDQDVHLLVAFSVTMVGSMTLERYAKMKPWQAALVMTVATGLFGTLKETLHDQYTSRTDIKTWYVGVLAGGLTFTALHF